MIGIDFWPKFCLPPIDVFSHHPFFLLFFLPPNHPHTSLSKMQPSYSLIYLTTANHLAQM